MGDNLDQNLQQEYIIIYQGCNDVKYPRKIALETKNIDYWAENRIFAEQFRKEQISEILIGPSTVLQYFESPNFTGHKNTIINSSKDKVKKFAVGCLEDHEIWRGKVRSFIIWTYDYYSAVFGIRYCKSDSDCGQYEACLCKDGQENPVWCPDTKRRCMNKGKFFNDAPYPIRLNQYVADKCLQARLDKKGDIVTFDDVKKASIKCIRPRLEGFGEDYSTRTYITMILIVLILLYIVMSC